MIVLLWIVAVLAVVVLAVMAVVWVALAEQRTATYVMPEQDFAHFMQQSNKPT